MTALSLTKIGIDGFRGLRKLELTDLGRVNILVGSNNSGKTSVLEALSVMSQPYNPSEWLSMLLRRDFGGLDETLVQSLHWCFTQLMPLNNSEQLIEAQCHFTCQGSYFLQELRVDYSNFFGKLNLDLTEQLDKKNFPGGLDWQKNYSNLEMLQTLQSARIWYVPNSLFTDTGLIIDQRLAYKEPRLTVYAKQIPPVFDSNDNAPKLDCKMLTPYSFQVNRNQVQELSHRVFEKDNPSVLELLQDFDADIEAVNVASFFGDRPSVYIQHRKLGVAPLSVFGDATRRAILLATTLLSIKQGGVLLIDEVEVGIHVGVLGKVFEWLVRAARLLDVQVFVTTHSLEAVDALLSTGSKLEADDIVAFQLSQSEEQTCCKRFAGDLLHRLRFERGLDVR